jgi:hypothetical protein
MQGLRKETGSGLNVVAVDVVLFDARFVAQIDATA